MKQELMSVVSQRLLAPAIYEMVLTGKLVQEMTVPGQFLHLKVPRADLLLRRPISLAKIDQEQGQCTIIYRMEGEGTADLSGLQKGDWLDVMGPLGNGFPLAEVTEQELVLIVGGGIGVPPLYELARQVKAKGAKVICLFGFATKDVVYYEAEFLALGELRIATDDGSYGTHGHVGHLLAEFLAEATPSAVYACGAPGLLRAVESNFHDHPRAYLSMEARMACGMGACYACTCQLQSDQTKSKKICDEGPIFATGEVII